MYLRKAWRYNKLFFGVVILFITGQAFVTINQGMVFSPFFNFSMYADAYPKDDSLLVLEMYTGGRPLNPSHVTTKNWDKLSTAYIYYADMRRNQWVLSEIQRLTGNAGLQWPIDPYQNQLAPGEMEARWRALFVKVMGSKPDSVKWSRYQLREGKWVKN